jgi:hypothetical protein
MLCLFVLPVLYELENACDDRGSDSTAEGSANQG